MKKNIIKSLTVASIVLSPISVFADNYEEAKAAAEATKAVDTADVTITITGNDTMQFDTKAFEVTEGQTVKVIFKNTGNLPKAAMGHNIVILKPDTDIAKLAMSAISAKENNYLPTAEDGKALIVAASKVLGPGEEEAITFTAGAAGEYPYICSFPGHFSLMKGMMTVKAK